MCFAWCLVKSINKSCASIASERVNSLINTWISFNEWTLIVCDTGIYAIMYVDNLYVSGTVITEWDDGKRHCEAILESEETYKRFANILVQIADYYGFDGWLINIENVIKVSLKQLHY